MQRSRDEHRSSSGRASGGFRSWLGGLRRGRQSEAGRLAAEAGASPCMEPLEERVLLFALTITPDIVNPATGVGEVVARFGYVLPTIGTNVAAGDPADADLATEDFNGETNLTTPGLTPVPNSNPPRFFVGNGTVLNESNLRIRHNISLVNDIQLVPEVGADPTSNEQRLRVALNPGEFIQFDFLNDAGFVRPINQFEMISAVDTANTTMEVRGIDSVTGQETIFFTATGNALDNFFNFVGGIGRFNFPAPGPIDPTTPPTFPPGFPNDRFSSIVFRRNIGSGPSGFFFIDDVQGALPPPRFAAIVDSEIFGGEVHFAGPVGATAQFLDLYGRDMNRTIALGIPDGGELTLVDRPDGGIPSFNYGIGQINISGSDSTTSLTMVGGTIASFTGMPPTDADFIEGGFAFTRPQDPVGIFDDFEQAGFGYIATLLPAQTAPTFNGLPPGPGTVIVGAPASAVRDRTSSATFDAGSLSVIGFNIPISDPDEFTQPDQGVFVLDGGSIGTINIHGVVHGSSRFTGAVDRFAVGYLVGTVTVDGDLGTLLVGSDAGAWEIDPGQVPPPPPGGVISAPVFTTGSRLVVGRTVGEIAIAGRSLVDVTVVGDLNSPILRPAGEILRYAEKENTLPVLPTADVSLAIDSFLNRISTNQPLFFGDGFFRNDSIMSAEFVGSVGTAVQIVGALGGQDPINTGEDPSDVFAFAVDGSRTLTIEVNGLLGGRPPETRIVDQDGRTLAALQRSRNRNGNEPFVLKFEPPNPGVFYLVLNGVSAGDSAINSRYTAAITGMAPVVLGSFRTGAGFGDNDLPNQTGTISVLSGSVGAVRIGTGFIGGDGADRDPTVTINTTEDDVDDLLTARSMSISIPGNLYALLAGSDINAAGGATLTGIPLLVIVGGNLGTLTTGLSTLAGAGVGDGPGNGLEGDVSDLTLQVGGDIGVIDIRGGIGIDQDITTNPPPAGIATPDNVSITTGTSGGSGNIGFFRVGSHVFATAFRLTMPPGSTLGAFLVTQDNPPNNGEFFGIQGSDIDVITGAGSDVRFVDFPQIDGQVTVNNTLPLIGGQPLELTDDGGGKVEIRVDGAPTGVTVGLVRVLPINQSLGVAIAQIVVNNLAGTNLRITSLGGDQDTISIGRIIIQGGDRNSRITIDGPGEIDVWRIDQTGGAAMDRIINNTPNGDIIAIDVIGLDRLLIDSGNLGSTEMPVTWGPKNLGPFLGIQSGLNTTVGGALGIETGSGAVMDPDWDGTTFAPVNRGQGGPNGSLDDFGSPFDPYLNGLVVRTGNTFEVTVGGSVGDVILQGGDITNVTANADLVLREGFFDGIVGTIYANNIDLVEVGQGLLDRQAAPLSTTGIFANDDIRGVEGMVTPGAFISSTILASDMVPGEVTAQVVSGYDAFRAETFRQVPERNGVARVELVGTGRIIDAYIASQRLDDFWNTFVRFVNDDSIVARDISAIIGDGIDIFRSQIIGRNIVSITLTNGFFDASRVQAGNNLGTIRATGFRNSTLTGGNLEFRRNEILVDNDLGTITTLGVSGTGGSPVDAGDIQDLRIDVQGSLTGQINARNLSRVDIDVDNSIALIETSGSLRGSTINAGTLVSLNALGSIRTSSIIISGPIESLTAGNEITSTQISVTGPDGRIDLVSARLLLNGSISATGPIALIQSLEGDIRATITTTTDRGDVGTLQAARDLDITTDISSGLTSLVAGRNIGNITHPGVILVRGDLATVDASFGQIYSDIRIGQALTGSASIGRVLSKPRANLLGNGSIVAFGPIAVVNIVGDFAGDIISYSGGIGTVTIVDGSFLPGHRIAAFDGDIGSVLITNGHLLGDIHADRILQSVQVDGGPNGVFGDIGINPMLRNTVFADAFRNQLPPGVLAQAGFQGPTISAGFNIGSIIVSNGSIFESAIFAGRAIGSVSVVGNIQNDGQQPGLGSVIAAGDSVNFVSVTGIVANAAILAGVTDLGADGRAGGTGINADRYKSGSVGTVSIGGSAANLIVGAGIMPGADGVYHTGDDLAALGVSMIGSVAIGGSATNVVALADRAIGATSPGVIRTGALLPVADSQVFSFTTPLPGTPLAAGTPLAFTLGSQTGTIIFTGPGQVRWDAAAGRVILVGTTGASTLTITSATGLLTNFDIVSRDESALGSLMVRASLAGDSDIVIDGAVATITTGSISGTGSIRVGGDVGSITTGNFVGGSFQARNVGSIAISGNFGNRALGLFPEIHVLSVGTVAIAGNFTGTLDSTLTIDALSVGGAMDRARVRSGDRIGSITAASAARSWISANNAIDLVTIAGDFFDSSIMVGADLGTDAAFGGTGSATDVVTTGSIGPVSIGGDFERSDVVAGVLRGPDGFFGTADDLVSEGRGSIDLVTIAGTKVGSNFNSESYRIASSGTIAGVTVGGEPIQVRGNFEVVRLGLQPLPIRVIDLTVDEDAQVYTARVFFNQPIDASSLTAALTVWEVRGIGDVAIRLVGGLDYKLTYNEDTLAAEVEFSRDITQRDLPQLTGVPGLGVYRFSLDPNLLRGTLVNAALDGDGDGFATVGDAFNGKNIVGDAGDKIIAETVTFTDPFTGKALPIDFYAPADLDVVLDSSVTPDGILDPNTVFTLRGVIGDHPDHDANNFRFTSDVDVYKITLQAGQILRLGPMSGAALLAGRGVFDSEGNLVDLFGTQTVFPSAQQLPSAIVQDQDLTQESVILVRQTGTFFIVVGNVFTQSAPGVVPDVDPIAGGVGDYTFTIEVFDDGNTGFAAASDAGNGDTIVNAPLPIDFAGADGKFGTSDDAATLVFGEFTFTLGPGLDGVRGTGDDVVSGTNGRGITSTRTNGNRLTTSIESAIGPRQFAGVPGTIFADADVYHLNNGDPLTPGTRLRVTARLTDLGADLGSRTQDSVLDFSGNVQFGIFDTTEATDISNASVLLSPTDFSPIGGDPGVIADNGTNSFGFDANGDFFIDLAVPAHDAGPDGQFGTADDTPASLAVYIQGVFRTDYDLQIVTQGVGPVAVPTVQNIFIETRGGTVDWLEAGGLLTELAGFSTKGLGFSGSIDGTPVDQFVLDLLVANLQAAFDAVGVAVNFSTNPADFELQEFSTVFLTDSDDPVNSLVDPFAGTGLVFQRFGYSERSDPLNIDHTDEAVVFLPPTSLLGFTPSRPDVEQYAKSLTAAAGRRVGELLGLRITADDTNVFSPIDLMAADGVTDPPTGAGVLRFGNTDTDLSRQLDSITSTDFYLGSQNSQAMLSRILAGT